MRPRAKGDDRLPDKSLVVGVRMGDEAKAYPHTVLAEQGMINDRLGERELLLWHDPDTASDTRKFCRRANVSIEPEY